MKGHTYLVKPLSSLSQGAIRGGRMYLETASIRVGNISREE